VRTPSIVIVVALAGACSPRPADAPRAHKVERVGASMGSDLRLTAWTADETAARSAFDAVFAAFERLEALMSVWRPGSDVLRINAAAGKQAVAVNADVRDVLRIARQVSEWTDGTFDVTFGALTDVWKFDHDLDGNIPKRADVLQRLPLVQRLQHSREKSDLGIRPQGCFVEGEP